ncbi:hypothetical protein RI054_07g38720 [Pseudoscourfieldia marina]
MVDAPTVQTPRSSLNRAVTVGGGRYAPCSTPAASGLYPAARRRAGSAEVGTEVQSRVVHQELRGSAAHAGAANAVDATVVPSERNVLSETTTNHLPDGADATKYYSLAELEVLASFGPGRAANDENAA